MANVEIRDIVTTKSDLNGTELVEMQELAGGINSSLKVNVAAIGEYVHKYKFGWVDYNDLTTSTTPVLHSGSGGYVKLTNDGAGTYTNKANLPVGVADIWNTTNSQFDFTQLSIGDTIDVRVDIEVTTTANNQDVDVKFELAIGGFNYPLVFHHMSPKAAGVYSVVRYIGIYIGDANTLDNPAEIMVNSDVACDVKVNGWYCKIDRR